jgi:Flp pilus assembly protein TadB
MESSIMRLPTLFKQQKNRTYSYEPRYYNERKERIERLKKEKEAREGASTDSKDYFRRNAARSFREDWRRKKSQAQDKNRRIRFFVILIFLFLMFYAAVQSGFIQFIQ